MDIDNPLDKHLRLHPRMPEAYRAASTDLAAELNLARLIAETTFKDATTPELTLAVYDRLSAKLGG